MSSGYGNVSGHTTVVVQLPVCIHTIEYPSGGVNPLHSTDPAGHDISDGPCDPDGPIEPDGPLGAPTPGFVAAQLAEVCVGPTEPLAPVFAGGKSV